MSAKGEERREAILRAAMRVLTRDGGQGFRMRAIAAEAGVGISHVQYYFKNIDAVMAGVMARYLEDWDELMLDAPASLAGALDFVLETQLRHGDCKLLWELWALSSRSEAADAALKTFYAGYTDRVCALLRREAPADAPDSVLRERAVLIVALIEGLSILRGNGREQTLAPQAQRHAINAALALAVLPLRPAAPERQA
ncbi:TetR/AcrR family transcriptional regulator [Chromobacterium sp.]|uniref:TetR/AcrR family transcriptional regulator n=1 Tax=Chromobacterium sp. TaxID=306190 RepID=UPI0035AE5E5F